MTTADLRELAELPGAARGIIALFHAYKSSVSSMRDLASQLYDGRAFHGVDPAHLPSEECSDVIQENLNYAQKNLNTPESVKLCRIALANYFPGALLMPVRRVLSDGRGSALRHRAAAASLHGELGAGLPSPDHAAQAGRGRRGVSLRARWDVHAAFLTPGRIRTQLSTMPDNTAYFCVARTIRKSYGYTSGDALMAVGIGCPVRDARKLVYADGYDLGNIEAAVPIGTTCRLCERVNCEQRAFPPMQHGLKVDENVRGRSFYAPVEIRAAAKPMQPPRTRKRS